MGKCSSLSVLYCFPASRSHYFCWLLFGRDKHSWYYRRVILRQIIQGTTGNKIAVTHVLHYYLLGSTLPNPVVHIFIGSYTPTIIYLHPSRFFIYYVNKWKPTPQPIPQALNSTLNFFHHLPCMSSVQQYFWAILSSADYPVHLPRPQVTAPECKVILLRWPQSVL